MKKKVTIIILTLIIFCIGSGIYIKTLLDLYPEVEISQQELYGKKNEKLKDFDITKDGLVSTTGDPWIEYTLDQRTTVRVIELDFSNVLQEKQWGEVIDMETWTRQSYDLKNGRVLVYYEPPEDLKELRFDPVSDQSVQLQIDRIIINSGYGILHHAFKMIGLLAVLMLSALFYFLQLPERKEKSVIGKIRVACSYGAGIMGLVLAGAVVYNIFVYRIVESMLGWFFILTVSFFLYGSVRLIANRHTDATITGMEILFFGILHVGLLEILSGLEFNFKNWTDGVWNLIYILFAVSVLYVIFRNKKIVCILTNVAVAVLGVANHYFYQFRGNPLELTDILMAKTAATVIGTYEFQIDNTLCFAIFVEMGFFLYIAAEKEKVIDKKRAVQSALTFALLGMLGISCYSAPISYWNMAASTQNIGYLNSFVAYARRDMKIEKPQGYSKEAVRSILEQYDVEKITDAEEIRTPNIIVIMDEAFADLPTTYGFKTEEDGMPFIHSLEENTIKGNMLVSVFGGSTANTEFEFLTGNSLAFLNMGVVPYMQYIKRNQESLASELKEYGYQTVAFHPQSAENYKRNSVYPHLGFEKFITIADKLVYTDKLRSHMSDEADLANVIDIYEKRDQNKPIFIFNVTMQNHGDYNRTQSEVEITVTPEDENLQYTQLLEYLSLVRKTDEAFEKLIDYFSQVKEDTIILMFGDHQPGLDSDVYAAMNDELYQKNTNIDTMEKMYAVPFIMWANYGILGEKNVTISPGYLRALLMQNTGLPLGQYEQFLLDCREHYSAINFIGYYDSEGGYYGMDESAKNLDWLQRYRMLEYGNMFDRSLDIELYE